MVLSIFGCAVELSGFRLKWEELFSEILRMLTDTPNLICLPTEARAGDKGGASAEPSVAGGGQRGGVGGAGGQG